MASARNPGSGSGNDRADEERSHTKHKTQRTRMKLFVHRLDTTNIIMTSSTTPKFTVTYVSGTIPSLLPLLIKRERFVLVDENI
jgi:hypothetical protein